MKTIAILISVFLLISCSNEKQVKIATFNIRYYNVNDGVNVWEARMPLVESFLKKESFDILGMQEVTHQQILDLQKILPDYDFAGTGRDNGKENGEYCPIFYKRDRYSLLAKSQFWLSETPEIPGSINWEGTFPRIVTWVKLKNNKTGHIFFVFNTHFCHINEYARKKSAILLLKKIYEIAGSAPTILTGDFNAERNSETYQILSSNWDRFISLVDTEDLAKKFVNKDSTTFNGFSNISPKQKIDYVFVNSYFGVGNYKIHIIKDGNVFISDHYPVSATLNFLFERRARSGPIVENPW